MVLALSVPREWVYRQDLIDLVFGAVLLTILLQAPTTPLVLRLFGLGRDQGLKQDALLLRTRMRALSEAERYLERQQETGAVLPEVYRKIRGTILERRRRLEEEGRRLQVDAAAVLDEERREWERQLALVEKETIRQAYAQGVIDDRLLRILVKEIDDQILALEEPEA